MATIPDFGRYEALLRLGKGGMAEVWAARLRGEAGFHRLVAIKRILPHLAADAELVDRFLDEARIAAHVTSPRVVTTLDLGRSEDGTPFIVLDLVVGVTLSHFVHARSERVTTPLGGREIPVRPRAPRGEIPLSALIELLAQVAEGLADVHEARSPEGTPLHIVHRDVSPQNVLVGVDGRARLSDFGVARAALSRVRTATGHVMGKYGYMAPEQARGERVDGRADVFSLGVVAWETIAGRRLFTAGRDEETHRNLLHAEVEPLARVRPDVPEALSRAIASALERDPGARCQSARELARALRSAGAILGRPPDARELAKLVEEAGGPALAEVQRRIGEAASSSTAGLIDITPSEPGPVNVSGEETFVGDLTEAAPLHEVETRLLEAEEDTTERDDPPDPATPPARTWLPLLAVVLLAALAVAIATCRGLP